MANIKLSRLCHRFRDIATKLSEIAYSVVLPTPDSFPALERCCAVAYCTKLVSKKLKTLAYQKVKTV